MDNAAASKGAKTTDEVTTQLERSRIAVSAVANRELSPRATGSQSENVRQDRSSPYIEAQKLHLEALKQLKRTIKMPHIVSTLFKRENFCFATKAPERKHTLYFAEGGASQLNYASRSGRLRQEHPSGPLVEDSAFRRIHLFFQSPDDLKRVRDELRLDQSEAAINYAKAACTTMAPQNDFYHLELILSEDGGNWTIEGRHASGGRVDSSLVVEYLPDPIDLANDMLIDGADFKKRTP